MGTAAAPRVRFDRNEISGAFGDIGTDFPLVTALILTAHLDPASVLTCFGAMQVATGFYYGLPMPSQPLKAMAALVIAQRLPAEILYGGGLAIGLAMLFLTVTGLLDRLALAIPKVVVRGIQFGLGLQLSSLACRELVPADGVPGYVLAAVAFALTLALFGNRRFPPATLLIALGVGFALVFKVEIGTVAAGCGFVLPTFRTPAAADIWTGFVVLALPQIALSLGNSILATRQIVTDLFPERAIGVSQIGLTYSLMNLVNPFFGGIPTCHGSGGMAGHHAFGARTGGSVVLYGMLYITLGVFFSGAFGTVIHLFPRPILGVILAFEGLVLLRLSRDVSSDAPAFTLVLLVGLLAAGVPYGYLIGLVVGTLLVRLAPAHLARLAG